MTTKPIPNGSRHALANAENGSPPGWSGITPTLHVENVEEACEFYASLGFTVEQTIPGPDGEVMQATLRLGSGRILVANLDIVTDNPSRRNAEQKGPLGLGFTLLVYVPNVNQVYRACGAIGIEADAPVHETPAGDRVFTIVDPFGFNWTFATHVKDVPLKEQVAYAGHP